MSLILDALNRSESERRGGDVPGLATEHFHPQERDAGGWRLYLPWIALTVAVAVIVFLLFKPAPAGDETGAISSSDDRVIEQRAEPAPGAITADSAKPAIESTPDAPAAVAPVPATMPEVNRAPVGPVMAEADTPENRDSEDAAVAALYRQAPPAPEPTVGSAARATPVTSSSKSEPTDTPVTTEPASPPAEQALDIEKVLASAQRELENARLSEHPAPFIEDLSQQRKDAIPTLMYSIHNYSGRPGESSVVLNGNSVRAGARVGKGVKVVEILPDSVVLEHQGEQFRLRALNSWVNL